MTQHEDSWKALLHTYELIRFADTKAAVLLAASGTLGGILLHGIPDLTGAADSAQIALRCASLGFVVCSTLLTLCALAPRLRRRQQHSLLYFGTIADRYPRATGFTTAHERLFQRDDDLREALAEQLWVNSHIARRKFRTVSFAIWLFGGAVLIGLASGALPG
ncbi:hypothetical protein GCM10027174_04300 [Salinifilum aidingensis]